MWYNTSMTLNLAYVPIFSGVMIILAVLIVLDGWRKGFSAQLVSIISLIASMFLAWPWAGSLMNEYELPFQGLLNGFWSGFADPLPRQLVWFVLVLLAIQFVAAIACFIIKKLRRIKLLSFADHFAGLGLAVIQAGLVFVIANTILQMPFFVNGEMFASKSVVGWSTRVAEPYVKHMLESYDLEQLKKLYE